MRLAAPLFLIAIPIIIGLAVFFKKKDIQTPGLRFSSGDFLKGLKSSLKVKVSNNVIFLRAIALILIAIALARPQSALEQSNIEAEGIDIVLVLDVSTSMLAEDFTLNNKRVNRLAVVKDVVDEFIKGRKSDRIGLVAFAARAYTVCPLTLDYNWLLENLQRVEIGIIEDSTAIGSGLSSALNRLKDTKAKSKVVILLTDGRNNTGKISPSVAAEAAKALKVKVYTIGAGTEGRAPFPVQDFFGRTVYQDVQIDIDEKTLKDIADKTDALYFRAKDTESLRKIYEEIDMLEKVAVKDKGYSEYKELFPVFLYPAILLLFLEIILSNTLLRKLP